MVNVIGAAEEWQTHSGKGMRPVTSCELARSPLQLDFESHFNGTMLLLCMSQSHLANAKGTEPVPNHGTLHLVFKGLTRIN